MASERNPAKHFMLNTKHAKPSTFLFTTSRIWHTSPYLSHLQEISIMSRLLSQGEKHTIPLRPRSTPYPTPRGDYRCSSCTSRIMIDIALGPEMANFAVLEEAGIMYWTRTQQTKDCISRRCPETTRRLNRGGKTRREVQDPYGMRHFNLLLRMALQNTNIKE